MRKSKRHLVALTYQANLHATSVCTEGGWRARLAWWLRAWADRLDDGQSLRLEMSSEPYIGAHTHARCVEAGLHHARLLMMEAAKSECIEDHMRHLCPTLYREDDQS